MNFTNSSIIALTCGDVNSISPLISLKSWLKLKNSSYMFFNIHNIDYMEKVISYFNLDIKIAQIYDINEAKKVFSKYFPVMNINTQATNFLGEPTIANANLTLQSINKAIELCKNNIINGLCTNPVDKNIINEYLKHQSIQHTKFVGHTEYIAQNINVDNPMMLFATGVCDFKVLPITTHIPLSEVASSLSIKKVYDAIININLILQNQFNIQKPKIGILGLNPHCGDNGLLGTEEQSIIIPAIKMAQSKNILCSNPISSDCAFFGENKNKYDIIIGMYHDQVLAPFKALYFDSGVNITCNLPFIRTSPDHGVAFDIAKQSIASDSSLSSAIIMAHKLIIKKNEFI